MQSFLKKFAVVMLGAAVLNIGSQTAVLADPAEIFPGGPYSATLIGEKILYPDLFGVSKGLPVADVSGVLLADGKIRAYVFAQNKGIVIAESTDGVTFSIPASGGTISGTLSGTVDSTYVLSGSLSGKDTDDGSTLTGTLTGRKEIIPK